MATFQIHPEHSRVKEDGVRVLSVTLFAEDAKHDTRDPKKCEANPHTTREFEFEAGVAREDVHATLQQAADQWAASVAESRERAKALADVL